MAGIGLLDLAADELFRGFIRRGDGGFVRFEVVADAFVVIGKRDPPGAVGKLFGEGEVGLEVHKTKNQIALNHLVPTEDAHP